MMHAVFKRTREGRLAIVMLVVGGVQLASYFAAVSIYGAASTGLFVEYMLMLGIAMLAAAAILFVIETIVLRGDRSPDQ